MIFHHEGRLIHLGRAFPQNIHGVSDPLLLKSKCHLRMLIHKILKFEECVEEVASAAGELSVVAGLLVDVAVSLQLGPVLEHHDDTEKE